jgi:hypothetical protein
LNDESTQFPSATAATAALALTKPLFGKEAGIIYLKP